MNELILTVNGWAATDPTHHVGPSGVRLTTFRLASTSRYFDREKNEWADGRTEWFSIKVFRAAAITVADSIKKGQPVTVTGRFRTSEWESDEGTRVDLVIDATSVGHDLTRGTATFTRGTGSDRADAEAKEAGIAAGPDGEAEELAAAGPDEEPAGESPELAVEVPEPELAKAG